MIAMVDRFLRIKSSLMSGCFKSFTQGGATRAGPQPRNRWRRRLDPGYQQRKVSIIYRRDSELVENNSTNNDATLDNLLPEGRDIHQVKDVVQYPDNQCADNKNQPPALFLIIASSCLNKIDSSAYSVS
jgi:hypothetical protein